MNVKSYYEQTPKRILIRGLIGLVLVGVVAFWKRNDWSQNVMVRNVLFAVLMIALVTAINFFGARNASKAPHVKESDK